MSSYQVDFSAEPRDASRQHEAQLTLRSAAFRQPWHTIETATDSHTAALVVRDPQPPAWGISRVVQNRYRLLLCGFAWKDPSATRLLTPDEALNLLLERGWGSAQSLLGQYLLVFIDTASRTVIVENDLFGLVPCYYRVESTGLRVSSEIKAFRSADATLDLSALAEIAKLGYIATDATLFSSVKRLPPSHRLQYRDGRAEVGALPLPPFERSLPLTDDRLDELNEAFGRYLDRMKASATHVSASLSGGLDSRIIVAALVRRGFHVTTFSSGERGSLECRLAQQFSDQVGVEQVTSEFEGTGFPGWFPRAVWATEGRCPAAHMHFLDAMVAGRFPKLPQFHGLLGDVVIGGDYDAPIAPADLPRIESLCRRGVTGSYWPAGALEETWASGLLTDIERVPEQVWHYASSKGPWSDPYSQYLWFRHIARGYGFITPCLGSQVLPWTQFLTPYLDPTFFELGARIRFDDIYYRRGQIRWAMRYYPEVAELPRVKDGALIPVTQVELWEQRITALTRLRRFRYLVTRASRGRINLPEREGYPAYGQWYRRYPNVRDYVNDTVLSTRSLSRGLWRAAGVRRLLQNLRVGRDVWPAVSTVLQLEVLLGQLFDGDTPAGVASGPMHDETMAVAAGR